MTKPLAVHLFNAVRLRATTRQARLLMVGCCRLRAGQFFDPRIEFVLGAAERCADDPLAEAAARARWDEIVTASRPCIPDTGPGSEPVRAVNAAWELVNEHPNEFTNGERYSSPRAALAHAVLLCLRDQPLRVFTGGAGDAVYYCLRAVARAGPLSPTGAGGVTAGVNRVDALMARVVRDIFGPLPFREVPVSPEWLTSDVVALARGIYDEKAFERLPYLADALMDAGCENEEVLEHCRGAGTHVRGCWVVDLLLGKT
jgi:hypothetical protein